MSTIAGLTPVRFGAAMEIHLSPFNKTGGGLHTRRHQINHAVAMIGRHREESMPKRIGISYPTLADVYALLMRQPLFKLTFERQNPGEVRDVNKPRDVIRFMTGKHTEGVFEYVAHEAFPIFGTTGVKGDDLRAMALEAFFPGTQRDAIRELMSPDKRRLIKQIGQRGLTDRHYTVGEAFREASTLDDPYVLVRPPKKGDKELRVKVWPPKSNSDES